MFHYFLYDVDVGLDAFKKRGNDLTPYDILIVDNRLNTEELERIIAEVQQNIPLKYVLLRNSHATGDVKHLPSVSTHLIKPVTEESIYELILLLFRNGVSSSGINSSKKNNIVDLEKVLYEGKKEGTDKPRDPNSSEHVDIHTLIEEHRGAKLPILDREMGESKTKEMGLKYSNVLENFLDTFDRSDLYFRQIVNAKAHNEIKEFCVGLEKQAKLIGAESMLKFAEIVNLVFVYNKLDLLPIYPGKYHIELQKLMEEIKKELHSK
jgi:hypothetical protein